VCVCVCVCLCVCVCMRPFIRACIHARAHTNPQLNFIDAPIQLGLKTAFTLRFLRGSKSQIHSQTHLAPPPLLLLLTPHLSLFTFGSGNAFGPIALAAFTEEAGDFESGHVSGLQNALYESLLRCICRQACSKTGRNRQQLTY
jgi:hypothetical protein